MYQHSYIINMNMNNIKSITFSCQVQCYSIKLEINILVSCDTSL